MTPERIEQERQAFETHFPGLKEIGSLRRKENGHYVYDHIELAWLAWRARAAQSDWISVKDRLPEEVRNYLACNAGGVVRVCRFDGKKFSYWEYDEEEWEDIEVSYSPDYWQPIPSAPPTNPAA